MRIAVLNKIKEIFQEKVFKIKQKTEDSTPSSENDKSVFIFSEPFYIFDLKGSFSERKIKDIAKQKAQFLLKTTDFFYAFRKTGSGSYRILLIAGQNRSGHHLFLKGQFPLLLHLKPGRYLIRGQNIIYNVDLSDEAVDVTVHEAPLEGFREPTRDDWLTPEIPLRWSLDSRDLKIFRYATAAAAALMIVGNIFLLGQIKERRQELTAILHQQSAQTARVVVDRSGIPSSNLLPILERIDGLGRRIRSVAYLNKVTATATQVKCTVRCFEKDCFIPVAQALRTKRPGEFQVIFTLK